MAPVAVDHEPSYLPVAAVASHLVSAVFLTAVVCRGLYRSYCDLTPSQGARARQAGRSRLVPVFGALAALGLAVATKSAVDYASLSYQVWADERFESPRRCFESDGRFPHLSAVNVARWLNDTPIYRDAREIVAEKARRLFWGQQADLGMAAWSLLLSIEGRRRRIPYIWAYFCLAQLVSLSFAQNLFYVAMLLTPTPLPPASGTRVLDRVFPPKPDNWFPYPVVTTSVLYLERAITALIPVMAGSTATSSWSTLVLRATGLVLLAIPTVAPQSWGAVYSSPHGAHDTHIKTFRTLSLATFVMHALSTGYALAYNAPDSHHHRHSIRMPLDEAKRSDWERASTAVAKVLGSTADHPVIIKAAWPFAASPSFGARSMANDVADTARSVVATAASGKNDNAESPAPAPRSRGRPRKIKWKDQTLEETDGDAAYKPSADEVSAAAEGDVLPEEDIDWEAAALTWVIAIVGGLGCGSAGVFGGECISR
ncbi:hypothetical protein MAPG_03015 [Magnaporthiopsis poae ATCC 64411]|uniref:Uncharacterized protein n=1 Tax=Magnaporthiopsis poae (strain ATCC 64411 / 73-15) TaxID=644358 RepID=A0A0C4DSX1_MAGP6|nr:hypothetical protein MAPG_03015 [Magnaporthiopsis poae ATCC 64411]